MEVIVAAIRHVLFFVNRVLRHSGLAWSGKLDTHCSCPPPPPPLLPLCSRIPTRLAPAPENQHPTCSLPPLPSFFWENGQLLRLPSPPFGASNICQVDDDLTCFVPTLWGGEALTGKTATMHDSEDLFCVCMCVPLALPAAGGGHNRGGREDSGHIRGREKTPLDRLPALWNSFADFL